MQESKQANPRLASRDAVFWEDSWQHIQGTWQAVIAYSREEWQSLFPYLLGDWLAIHSLWQHYWYHVGLQIRCDWRWFELNALGACLLAADPTLKIQRNLADYLASGPLIQSGDSLKGVSLWCLQCGHIMRLTGQVEVPPCASCQARVFQKISG